MAASGGSGASSGENHVKEETAWERFAPEFLKSMVYGGMDGIITTFAIVCAACGADFASKDILIVGVSSLVADAISMGIGDFLSDRTEQDYARTVREKKRQLLQHSPQAAHQVLVQAYCKQGISASDAEKMARILGTYEGAFLDHCMIHDDGVMPPDDEPSSVQKGVVTFFSFLVFGSVPLAVFLVGDTIQHMFSRSPLLVSSVASAMTMFVLGVLSGTLTQQGVLRSGIFMTLHGLLAAYAAYAIGQGMDAMGNGEDSTNSSWASAGGGISSDGAGQDL